MKILCKVVDEVFRTHPEMVKDAEKIKAAGNYLEWLVIKEMGTRIDQNLVKVFVQEKLRELADD